MRSLRWFFFEPGHEPRISMSCAWLAFLVPIRDDESFCATKKEDALSPIADLRRVRGLRRLCRGRGSTRGKGTSNVIPCLSPSRPPETLPVAPAYPADAPLSECRSDRQVPSSPTPAPTTKPLSLCDSWDVQTIHNVHTHGMVTGAWHCTRGAYAQCDGGDNECNIHGKAPLLQRVAPKASRIRPPCH